MPRWPSFSNAQAPRAGVPDAPAGWGKLPPVAGIVPSAPTPPIRRPGGLWSLCGRGLQSEELKIAFVKNRMQGVRSYSGSFTSTPPRTGKFRPTKRVSCNRGGENKRESMIEMIFQSGQSLPMGEAGQSEYVRKIRDLREEVNWYYPPDRIGTSFAPEEKSRERLELLHQAAQLHEKELLRALRELPAQERENATLDSANGAFPDEVAGGAASWRGAGWSITPRATAWWPR